MFIVFKNNNDLVVKVMKNYQRLAKETYLKVYREYGFTSNGLRDLNLLLAELEAKTKNKAIKVPFNTMYLKTLKPIEKWGVKRNVDFSVIPDRELTQSFINWYVNLIETIFAQKEKTFPLANEKEEGYRDLVNYFKRKSSSVRLKADGFYKKVNKRKQHVKAD